MQHFKAHILNQKNQGRFMEQCWLTYDNRKIFYRVAGSGPSVVLIHGFAEDGDVWSFQEKFLRNNFRLIIPDLPGSGKSELLPLSGIPAINFLDTYADIIKKILVSEKVTTSTVIGHSMGGYIALAFAQNHPDNINGLGLFHSSAYADSEERKNMRRKGIDFIQRYGSHEFLKQSIPNLFAKNFTDEHPEDIERLIEKAGNFTAEALVQYYEAMLARPERISVLENFSNPVLFIIGEEDKSVYLQDSLTQCHLPVLSLINILPGVAHMGMWEKKDLANITVMKFLNYVLDA